MQKAIKIQSYLKDIRFWIIAFFIIRLFGITNAPLEIAHNWRQTTVTMVARNFSEIDNNIFFPRIDIAGEKTGITGMEFPILNYLIYLVSALFGYAHWYGRLINLLFSSGGIYMFYLLIKKYFDSRLAFKASLILLCSIWFAYARKIMPDTMAMSFILAAIYFGSNYLDQLDHKRKYFNLILSLLLMTLGTLAKLPSAYLLIVFTLFILKKEIPNQRKIIFCMTAALCMLFPLIWYFYWVPYLVETYGFWHFFMGKSISEGSIEILNHLNKSLANFYEHALKFIGFAFFLVGLFYLFIRNNKILIGIVTLALFSFIVVMLKAGLTFAYHSYYIIPFVPVMALVCGYGIEQIKIKKIGIVILVAICAEGILNQQHDFRLHDKQLAMLQLETDLNAFSAQQDLILINSGDVPTPMYFAHRKGWVNSNEKITNENYIYDLKAKGLKLIVVLKRAFADEVHLNYKVVLDNPNYCIYKP